MLKEIVSIKKKINQLDKYHDQGQITLVETWGNPKIVVRIGFRPRNDHSNVPTSAFPFSKGVFEHCTKSIIIFYNFNARKCAFNLLRGVL